VIYGWGINDVDYVICPTINGKRSWCPYYMVWKNMVKRCHYLRYQKRFPTYKGCKIAEKWKYFSVFRAWMEIQDWEDKQLDKDFLGDGKLYSPETCCFVPGWLNSLFTDSGKTRGKWPIGVYWYKQIQKFRAYVNINGQNKYLGSFDTPEEAHQTYLKAKRKYIIEKMIDYPDKRIKKVVLERAKQTT